MKYFAVMPIRRDWIVDTGETHVLALVDEENLCRCLHLIGQERQIHTLQKEIDELQAEQDRLEAKLAELKNQERIAQ